MSEDGNFHHMLPLRAFESEIVFQIQMRPLTQADIVSIDYPTQDVEMVDNETLLRESVIDEVFDILAVDNDQYHRWCDLRHTCSCRTEDCIPCAVRDCPHLDPLHYHHDGCPACGLALYQETYESDDETRDETHRE